LPVVRGGSEKLKHLEEPAMVWQVQRRAEF
jgi:hypothetical protein